MVLSALSKQEKRVSTPLPSGYGPHRRTLTLFLVLGKQGLQIEVDVFNFSHGRGLCSAGPSSSGLLVTCFVFPTRVGTQRIKQKHRHAGSKWGQWHRWRMSYQWLLKAHHSNVLFTSGVLSSDMWAAFIIWIKPPVTNMIFFLSKMWENNSKILQAGTKYDR